MNNNYVIPPLEDPREKKYIWKRKARERSSPICSVVAEVTFILFIGWMSARVARRLFRALSRDCSRGTARAFARSGLAGHGLAALKDLTA
jgi:hypothetical protein